MHAQKGINNKNGWNCIPGDKFWLEIAPGEHILQIYESDELFMNSLAGYITGGIRNEESVIIIATAVHLQLLESRLNACGMDMYDLIRNGQLIEQDTEETMAGFMVDGWPDEQLFMHQASALFKQASRNGRKVRAFGEMVAVLWEQGLNGATLHLEHLWNKFCSQNNLSLYCAYPHSGLRKDANISISHICSCHTKIIDLTGPDELLRYKDLLRKAG